jgi:dihydroxyacetone kinase DhaKLM complex PTS-EIIA-like component DhaM
VSKGKIGLPSEAPKSKRNRWIQTEASSHEAWAKLILKHQSAAAFMHTLVARMDRNTNAVVASQGVLAKMMGVSIRSIKNWIRVLEEDKWIQVVKLGKGTANAYVVNSMVGWAQARDNLQYSQFSAQVIADIEDQNPEMLKGDLRKIPVLFDGDEQLPAGLGEPPPSQPLLEGTEPDLPAIREEQQELPLDESQND